MLTAAVAWPGPGRLHRVHERVVGAQRTDHGVTLALGSGKACSRRSTQAGSRSPQVRSPTPSPARDDPRVAGLLTTGLATPDPTGLGLHTTPSGL
ncbi:hypothetical protein ACWGQL_12245 [Streptomyces lydicus]